MSRHRWTAGRATLGRFERCRCGTWRRVRPHDPAHPFAYYVESPAAVRRELTFSGFTLLPCARISAYDYDSIRHGIPSPSS